MFTLETYLTGHELRMRELPGLASGSVRLDRVHFIFDSAWDGLTKVALFWGADSDTPFGAVVDAEGYAIVPWEVLEEKSIIRFGVYGTGTDTRLTSTLIRYKVQQGAWSEEIGNSGAPTPSMIEQFEVAAQAAIDAAQAVADQAKQIADNVTGNLAADYSAQATYALGAFCIQNGVLYRCTTPITTPEAWNASHWAVASVGDELVAMKATTAAAQTSADNAQADVDDLKSAVTNTTTKSIPCSFSSAGSTSDLVLSGYTGKKVFVSNKNLMPQFPQYTNNGVTFTPNDDGSLALSGTATATATMQLTSNTMPNLGAGTYTLSCGNAETIGDSNTYLNVAIDGSYAAIYARLNTVDGQTTFTVPEGSRVTAIRIRISSGFTVPDNFKIYPQCEEGTEKTAFVKHEGSVLEPTSASVVGVAIFPDYTYICAQSGVTGNVTFEASKFDEMQAEIDELNDRVTALENASDVYHKFAGKKIVCFGDSITGNYQPPADYPSMIAEITGATVYNAGFGGCCMSDNGQTRKDFTMCRLTDAIVAGDFSAQRNSGVSITYGGTSIDYVPSRLTMLEGINWSDIDYITIAYGTNDWNSNYGLDNANDPLDTTTYIGAFRYSVEKLLAAYPNIKIMVLTPLWRWWDTNTGMPSEIHTDYIDSNDYAKGTGYKLWQYGDALVAAAKLYHIPVFDLYWNCMMTKQNRFEYFNANDGTHPKLAGIQMMSRMISAHMESVY